jgi:Zn-dependent peptidase ImmA (M78 family)
MHPDISDNEFAATLDACARDALWQADIVAPPVDARLLATRLGLVVADHDRFPGRAHFVRLAAACERVSAQPTIVVGHSERPERAQWAIAHEIGESLAHEVFTRLGVLPQEVAPTSRELVANRLASCLLLPRRWFAADGADCDWDLFELKNRYATASHELIARRMLEMAPPIAITLCDLGRVVWRKSNTASRLPPLVPEERNAWQRSHATARPCDRLLDPLESGLERIRCWPVHEPHWKREILRCDIADRVA